MEEYLLNWKQACTLLSMILDSVERDQQGNYYIRRSGAMHYLPDTLTDALRDADSYLATLE
jgi:hypothetical protein